MQIVQEIMTFLVPFVVGILVERFVGVFDRAKKLIGR